MDRLKFRLWDKDIGHYFEKPYIFINTDGKLVSDDCVNVYEIDQKAYIVEKCTGLKDKNGKLIYENDYVKYKGNIYKVFWNKMKISLENILNNDIIDVQEFDCMEVIGNEHEKGNIRKI